MWAFRIAFSIANKGPFGAHTTILVVRWRGEQGEYIFVKLICLQEAMPRF